MKSQHLRLLSIDRLLCSNPASSSTTSLYSRMPLPDQHPIGPDPRKTRLEPGAIIVIVISNTITFRPRILKQHTPELPTRDSSN